MRIPAAKAIAAASLALAAGIAAAAPAFADDYSTAQWYDNDYHSVLPGTSNWYEAGFSSTAMYDSTWGNNLIFSNVSSWADTGGSYTPDYIQLDDLFQADGVGMNCTGSIPAGLQCNASFTQTNVTKTVKSSHTKAVNYGVSAVHIGGNEITWGGEYATGTFGVGSSVYEADASEGEGWAG